MQRTLATSAVLACLPALAQQAPAGPASQTTLQPVVVTAMPGVAQSAFDTPVSIDVIGDTQLRDAQLGVNLSESLARAPGITALNRQNYAQDIQISSRGYGARSTFGARGLRLYTDGIPATAADGQGQVSHFDLNSADRIEVLRGPFSALYGNSSGGVISLFTADGGPRTVAEVSSAVASFGTQRHAVRLSGQQGAVQYNLSATRFDTDGARAHSAATREGFNGKVKYTASEATKVTVILNSVRLPDAQDPMGLTRAEYDADPRQASPAALQFDTRKSVQQTQGGVVVDHRLDAVHAVKFTGWSGTRETVQFQSIPVGVQTPITQPGGVIGLDRRYAGFDAQWTA
ncbi:MAG: TonB-dependent receptor plug domain-containing protein, partial [Ramlibacter sp.]